MHLDKKLAQIMEVDMRLAQADFGDDYIPTEPAARLKSQLQLYTKLSPQLQVNNSLYNSSENFNYFFRNK